MPHVLASSGSGSFSGQVKQPLTNRVEDELSVLSTDNMIAAITLLTVTAFGVAFGLSSDSSQDCETDPDILAFEARLDDARMLVKVQVRHEVTNNVLDLGRLVAMGGAEAGGHGLHRVS